jgi:cytidylate kinase
MYRAVTWAALHEGIDPGDADAIGRLAEAMHLELSGSRVLVNGRDVTAEIRDPQVTDNVSAVADIPRVRQRMVFLQRQIASRGHFVCEGRDQGTVAFPAADVKIFLTALPEHRARRRWQELLDHHVPVTFDEVLAQQTERDRRDTARPVGGLLRAADAVEVNTDGKSIAQVVDELEQIVRRELSTTE